MVAILAVLGGGYLVARPRMPVEFLDGTPDVSFVTSGQRPFIDFRAPILGHVRIPNTDLIGKTDTQPDIIFGYLDWSRESQDEPVFWRAGGIRMPATYAEGTRSNLLEVPYATNPEQDIVELVRGTTAHRIRLPVKPNLPAAKPVRVELKAGNHTITVESLPRLISNAPPMLKLTTNAPPDREFAVLSKWRGTSECWLVKGGAPTYVRLPRNHRDPNLKGEVVAIRRTSEKLVLKNTVKHGLWLLKGDLVFWGKVPKPDMLGVEVGSHWFSNASRFIQTHGKATKEIAVSDLLAVDASAIWIGHRWPIEPVAIPMPGLKELETFSGMHTDGFVFQRFVSVFNPTHP